MQLPARDHSARAAAPSRPVTLLRRSSQAVLERGHVEDLFVSNVKIGVRRAAPRTAPTLIVCEPAHSGARLAAAGGFCSRAQRRPCGRGPRRHAVTPRESRRVACAAVLGVVTCGLALLAHFHPAKFPANYWLTLGCVVGYVACNAALQLFAAYFERDVFLFTRPPPPVRCTAAAAAVAWRACA